MEGGGLRRGNGQGGGSKIKVEHRTRLDAIASLGVGCWMFGVGCFAALRFRLRRARDTGPYPQARPSRSTVDSHFRGNQPTPDPSQEGSRFQQPTTNNQLPTTNNQLPRSNIEP